MNDEKALREGVCELEAIERKAVRINAHLSKARAALRSSDITMLTYHLEEAQQLNWNSRKMLLGLGVSDSSVAHVAALEVTAVRNTDPYLDALHAPE